MCALCVLSWTGCSTKPAGVARPCEVALVTDDNLPAVQSALSPDARSGDVLLTGTCYLDFISLGMEIVDLRSRDN